MSRDVDRHPASTPHARQERAASPAPGRVIVERVQPAVDGGRFPIKRTPGESVQVTADVFADGHDMLAGVVKYRRVAGRAVPGPPGEPGTATPRPGPWSEVRLSAIDNDRWGAAFVVTEIGEYEYTVEAWVDRFGSWLRGLIAKADAGQDVASELLEGAALIEEAASRLKPALAEDRAAPARREDSAHAAASGHPAVPARVAPSAHVRGGARRLDDNLGLLEAADLLRSSRPQPVRVAAARETELQRLIAGLPDRSASTTAAVHRVIVDPERARVGAWYEMFPRSCTADAARGGTFREAEARLPAIAGMGFDVLYLPPIHPIGHTHRKGRNNALTAAPGDPGSPWAIGSEAGGHTAVDPGLGTIEDFDRFVAAARHVGLDVALDIAFQASPDHPWVREHPEWFRHRPDGSIKYAENPPKKYQDIYPFDFETPDRAALWDALRDVFLFWVAHGVTIFRVDNPHTKPLPFWEWAIAEVRQRHPEAIFLAEAFTRPKVMRYLAKAGFNQSYTYFTWRNSAAELREYLTELTRTELQEYMRPNFFANTPDILHEYLQTGGRPAFEVRLVLAATLAASYGIYSGFELCEDVPIRAGSEEYLDSEKYQLRPRDWQQGGNLNELIGRVNAIRGAHPALRQNATLAFHPAENPALLWFSKQAGADRVFVVANTDPHWMQHGRIQVPIAELGIGAGQSYIVEDLLDEARYVWQGDWNYVRLDPAERVAHIFVVRD